VRAQIVEALGGRRIDRLVGTHRRRDREARQQNGQGDDESRSRLATILYTSAEALRIVTALLGPVLPESAAKIWSQLGFTTQLDAVKTADLHWGHLKSVQPLGAVSAVFPRADVTIIPTWP
jgi:methionyl-tRNA synthetase